MNYCEITEKSTLTRRYFKYWAQLYTKIKAFCGNTYKN